MEIPKPVIWIGSAMAALLLSLYLFVGGDQFSVGMSRWLTIGLASGSGFALGWFVSPKAKKARRFIFLGLSVAALFVAFTNNGVPGSGSTWLLSAIGFFAALGYWSGTVARNLAGNSTAFGSAEWATPDYLREHDLVGAAGLSLGTISTDEGPVRLRYDGDRHLLTIAPTRSGKGTTAIIPNLLTYKGSALVIDPKGENAMITAHARTAMGHTVHVVDPWMIASGVGAPSRFNPLDWLTAGDPDITENAMLLADALVVADGKGESFWTEEAKALLQGLILYVATDERERETRTLGRVRDLLLLDGDEMPALFARMMESLHHVVASTGARCLQKDEKLLANVVASAQAQTHFLDSPRLRENLSASDFRFEDLKREAMTVYLVLPADRLDAFGRWLRLLIQQAITVNARNVDVRPALPVLFLLDEMPALGRLTMVEQAYGLMAGFGMQLWGIVQDAGQLKRIYGDGWEGFIANSGAVQYFGSRDRMTAEYFSALCGETTVWSFSAAISHAFTSSSSGGSNSNSTTRTSSAAQRKLAYPDELMRLHSGRQLVLIENHSPIIANKVRWFEDSALRALGRDLRRTEGAVQRMATANWSAASDRSARTNLPSPSRSPRTTGGSMTGTTCSACRRHRARCSSRIPSLRHRGWAGPNWPATRRNGWRTRNPSRLTGTKNGRSNLWCERRTKAGLTTGK